MLKNWLKKRKERATTVAYEEGFGWACTEILLNGRSSVCVQSFYNSWEKTAFDLGAWAAVDELVKRGVIEDDRI